MSDWHGEDSIWWIGSPWWDRWPLPVEALDSVAARVAENERLLAGARRREAKVVLRWEPGLLGDRFRRTLLAVLDDVISLGDDERLDD